MVFRGRGVRVLRVHVGGSRSTTDYECSGLDVGGAGRGWPARDWVSVGGDLGQKHYSALTQINKGNVGSLKLAWTAKLDGSGVLAKYRNEGTPLVYDGVMYMSTGNNDVFAFDAKTGERLWTHPSNIPQNINTICCGWDARGLGLGDGLIYSAQLDGRLVALSQQTGDLVWAATMPAGRTATR